MFRNPFRPKPRLEDLVVAPQGPPFLSLRDRLAKAAADHEARMQHHRDLITVTKARLYEAIGPLSGVKIKQNYGAEPLPLVVRLINNDIRIETDTTSGRTQLAYAFDIVESGDNGAGDYVRITMRVGSPTQRSHDFYRIDTAVDAAIAHFAPLLVTD